jgi:hypothetical protein
MRSGVIESPARWATAVTLAHIRMGTSLVNGCQIIELPFGRCNPKLATKFPAAKMREMKHTVTLIALCALGQEKAYPPARVPFIGCESAGQVLRPAPVGSSKSVHLDPAVVEKLAYYKTEEGPGILAPRGWHCYGTIGSSGNSTIVSPLLQEGRDIFHERWSGFAGPAVIAFQTDGTGSGRLFVAEIVARAFPAKRYFAEKIIRDWDAKEIQFGLVPTDLLTYRSPMHVEFRTPAQMQGLGTMRWLSPGNDSVDGSATILNSDFELIYVGARLPTELRHFAPHILRQVRAEYTK